MDKVLLDTDIFSEILKGIDANVAAQATAYRVIFGRYTISTITVLEIVKGLHKMQRKDRIQQFLDGLSAIEVLTVSIQSAELAGRIYADLERTGQPIGRADPIVAGIALEHGLLLVTGNQDHYQRIQALGYDLKLDNSVNNNRSPSSKPQRAVHICILISTSSGPPLLHPSSPLCWLLELSARNSCANTSVNQVYWRYPRLPRVTGNCARHGQWL